MRAILLALMVSSAVPAAATAADRIAGGPNTKAVLALKGASGTGGDHAIDYQQDRDWYKLVVTKGADYVVFVQGIYDGDNPLIDLTLYDAKGHKVYYQPGGNAIAWAYELHGTTVKFIAKPTTVFVGLSSGQRGSTGHYDLSFHHSCAHNKATICTIKPGQTVTAFEAGGNDTLWFRTSLVKGKAYTTGSYRASATLRNAAGAVLQKKDCYDFSCVFKAAYTGSYFLELGDSLSDPHAAYFGDRTVTLSLARNPTPQRHTSQSADNR